MPPTLTYPGVYIEELPSGVHTITGVATSIAAFVGWASKGPTGEAALIESWADYETQFGGLDTRSYLGYAVNQFFANGGQQAYIVRIAWDASQPPAPNTNPVPAGTARAAAIGFASSVITATLGSVSSSTNLNVGSPPLVSMTVALASPPFLQVGQSLQLTVTGTYADGSTATVTTAAWNSVGAAVTVSAAGLVTAAAPGNATVSATVGAITASVALLVSSSTLTSIAVTPATPSIALGQTQQLKATGTYLDGSSQDITSIATWTSGTPANAAISGSGLATSVAAGTSVMTAALGGVSGNTTLTVAAAALVSIAVTPANPAWIHPADTVQFKATATYTDGSTADVTTTATWASSNLGVATVVALGANGGKATGVAIGTTQIAATVAGVSGAANLKVIAAAVTLSSISITPLAPNIPAGLTQQLAAQGTYSDGQTQDLTAVAGWTSATLANATMNGSVVTGVGAGSSVITAKVGAVSGTVTVAVGAPVLQSIAITPANPAVASGATQAFTATGTYSLGPPAILPGVTWSSSNPAAATITGAGVATAVAAGGSLTLFAANPGAWANSVTVSVVTSPSSPGRFSIQVRVGAAVVENFTNLSVVSTDPQYVVTVIDNDSEYISFINPATNAPVVPAAAPVAGGPVKLSGGADGTALVPASDGNFEIQMTANATAGVYLLDRVDIFNLLCVPGETDAPTIQTLQAYCAAKRAFYIVDPPQTATFAGLNSTGPAGTTPGSLTSAPNAGNSAYYFPWISAPDPLFGNRAKLFPPCGFVAGIYAATDSSRGVWKAPAGIDAGLTGVLGLQYKLTDLENGNLNIQGINCFREFKVYGDVVWGARTLLGNDQAGSQWKYVPIRRLALFIESSLYDGTQWVVFEPNDVPLWAQIRMNVGAFMQGLFLQGAFQGTTPQQAYFVKCDGDNNPPASVALGVVNILVGFAPLYPAEFVVIQIQQMAAQAQ